MGWPARGCLLQTPWLCDMHYCAIKAEIPTDFTHLESTMLKAQRSIGCDCILNLIMRKRLSETTSKSMSFSIIVIRVDSERVSQACHTRAHAYLTHYLLLEPRMPNFSSGFPLVIPPKSLSTMNAVILSFIEPSESTT